MLQRHSKESQHLQVCALFYHFQVSQLSERSETCVLHVFATTIADVLALKSVNVCW